MKVFIGDYRDDDEKRDVQVSIDDYDLWSMDNTLAYIIAPMLKMLIDKKYGSPFVNDEDVPEHLRSTAAPPKENDWDTDDLWHQRWEYTVGEMFWAMTQLSMGNDTSQFYDHSEVDHDADINVQISQMKVDDVGLAAHQARVQNGCVLFGKYFQNLWD